ncbi:hypothetical protein E4K67_06720 [Desulfosporosinus fructosivorans]|uniref:Uncharacterized protein n=1 Tax=Desulfosporosinus fructosivorans TaxID=2018669 RepID=A0A4Z0R8K3_9FIRM|nr:hypothetical protein [Desulfosporosinus fructosivorans]TGE39150.1 hypothetical protein E4K67_06720 [Desulfosporosinus fructosivorans]
MKKGQKMILACAATLAIGAGAVIGNGYLVPKVIAADTNQNVPVIETDGVPVQVEAKPSPIVLIDSKGQTVLSAQKTTIDLDEFKKVEEMTGIEYKKYLLSMTEEERESFSKKLAESGYDLKFKNIKPIFVDGTPSENDLAEAEAVKIAKNAVVEKYALTNETLARFSIDSAFNVVNPDQPEWSITLYPTNQDDFSEIGTYHITIKSPSGEIVKILSAADAVG